jgi:DNA-binding MarR family transcriptional regulator
MENERTDYGLLDDISDKYLQLRKTIEEMWNSSYNVAITSTEWQILSLIYGKKPAIAEITKKVDISRQATHKNIKLLHSKGLITIHNVENNNRNKYLELTSFGEACYLDSKLMKESIEKDIVTKIGPQNAAILKNILQMDWN